MKTKVQKIVWSQDGNLMTITYEKIGEEIVIDKRLFKAEIRAYAENHGLEQRFRDLESGDKVGQAKFDAAVALKEQYQTSTDWTRQAERDTLAELITAVSKVLPEFSEQDLRDAVEADPEQVEDWRADPRVKVELAEMRLTKAKARVKVEGAQTLKVRGLK